MYIVFMVCFLPKTLVETLAKKLVKTLAKNLVKNMNKNMIKNLIKFFQSGLKGFTKVSKALRGWGVRGVRGCFLHVLWL